MRRILQTVVFMLVPFFLFGQDLGKIAGKVTDESTGEVLTGANVLVVGTSYGAATNTEGEYRIFGLPVGVYELRVEYIGYRAVLLSNVRVSAGLTTESDFALSTQAIEAGALEVVADRPLINRNATNAVRDMNSGQIENMATRDVAQFFNMQAGVSTSNNAITVRGSRPSEVGYELEGASTKSIAVSFGSGVLQMGSPAQSGGGGGGNVFNLSSTIPEALEQITLQSGGYTAELGGANAGIIQQRLKTGGSTFSGSFGFETDGPANALDGILGGDETFSYGHQEMTATLGGPITQKIRFFGAYQNWAADDYAPQIWPGGNINNGDPLPVQIATGAETGDSLALVWDAGATDRPSERQTINGTLLFDFNPIVLRVGYAQSTSSSRIVVLGGPIEQMFNMDRQPQQDDISRLINLKLTYFLSNSTFLNLNYNTFNYYRERYDPLFGADADFKTALSWADSASVVAKNPDYLDTWSGAATEEDPYFFQEFAFERPGANETVWRKDVQDYTGLKAGLVSQTGDHEIKLGFDYRKYSIRRLSIGPATLSAINQGVISSLISQEDVDTQADNVADIIRSNGNRFIGYDEFGNEVDGGLFGAREPSITSLYFNDKVEMKDVVMNFGLRYETFNLDDIQFRDAANPAWDKADFGVHDSLMKGSDPTTVIQPRLGLAFSLSDKTVFHLQYGKFAQFPEMASVYKGEGVLHSVLGGQNFQRDPVGFGLDPVVTTQYEVGFSYEFIDGAAFDVTAFTRNTVGQLTADRVGGVGVDEVNDYNVASNVAFYKNGDFSAASGLELSVVTRRMNNFQASMNYTWTDARGTNSYPNSLVGTLNFNNTQSPTLITPMMYSFKHQGTVNLDYRFGADEGGLLLANSGMNLLFSYNSGHPFTRVDGGFGQRAADEGALLNEVDPRQRIPQEPLGDSTTPWVINTDLRLTKGIALGGVKLDAYILVTNMFNAEHVVNVYGRTGNAHDDGFLTTPDLSGTLLANHTDVYRELYEVVNLGHRQHYNGDTAQDLFGEPRQVKFGVGVKF